MLCQIALEKHFQFSFTSGKLFAQWVRSVYVYRFKSFPDVKESLKLYI